MNVFVSYTRRDGAITTDLLRRFAADLSERCSPYVHALEESRARFQQLRVLLALVRAKQVIHITSPLSLSSPWVRLELRVAWVLRKPVAVIDASDLSQRLEGDRLSRFRELVAQA